MDTGPTAAMNSGESVRFPRLLPRKFATPVRKIVSVKPVTIWLVRKVTVNTAKISAPSAPARPATSTARSGFPVL